MSKLVIQRALPILTMFALVVSLFPLAVVAAQSPTEAGPSKVSYVILDRIERMDKALGPEDAGGRQLLQAAEVLSDASLQVNGAGEFLLEYHSAHAIGPAEIRSIEARGGRISISTADLVWPKGMEMPPGLGIIVAWMPYRNIVSTAEALPWVVAVTPM